jgi:hypothetical protein
MTTLKYKIEMNCESCEVISKNENYPNFEFKKFKVKKIKKVKYNYDKVNNFYDIYTSNININFIKNIISTITGKENLEII